MKNTDRENLAPVIRTPDRIVYAQGAVTNLLNGDADTGKYPTNAVLPALLTEGWEIKRQYTAGDGVYFVLSFASF